MGRQIVLLGHLTLRQRAQPVARVTDATRALIAVMFDAMHERKGIGLAANQVAESLRVFITNAPDDHERVFINPEIVETSIETEVIEEGCLSIPGVNADIERPSRVRVQALNLKGRPFVVEATEMLARVVQHELDHLNGRLFIDHLDWQERQRVLDEYAVLRGSDNTEAATPSTAEA